MGEHIRKVRIERNQSQKNVAKVLNTKQIHLSSWELNRKAPHPKYLESIIDYLGYIPNIKSKFEKLGMRTKLYRMKYKISLRKFCKMNNIDISVVNKLEYLRFRKSPKNEQEIIENVLQKKPIFFLKV